MTNDQLAKALEYIGSAMKGGISDAVLKEAAKRLRCEPEMVPASRPQKPPTLNSYAIPEEA